MPLTPEEIELEYKKRQTDEYKIWSLEIDIDSYLRYSSNGYDKISYDLKNCVSTEYQNIIKKHYEEKGWEVEWMGEQGRYIELKPKAKLKHRKKCS